MVFRRWLGDWPLTHLGAVPGQDAGMVCATHKLVQGLLSTPGCVLSVLGFLHAAGEGTNTGLTPLLQPPAPALQLAALVLHVEWLRFSYIEKQRRLTLGPRSPVTSGAASPHACTGRPGGDTLLDGSPGPFLSPQPIRVFSCELPCFSGGFPWPRLRETQPDAHEGDRRLSQVPSNRPVVLLWLISTVERNIPSCCLQKIDFVKTKFEKALFVPI